MGVAPAGRAAKRHLRGLPAKAGDKPLKRLELWKVVRFGFRSSGFGFRSRRTLILFRLVLISFRRILNSFHASCWKGARLGPTRPASKECRHPERSEAIQGNVGRPTFPWIATPSEKTGVSRRPMAARDDGAAFVLSSIRPSPAWQLRSEGNGAARA